jgi:polysaccharide export outer membrane protein
MLTKLMLGLTGLGLLGLSWASGETKKSVTQPATPVNPRGFVIGPGDVLQIDVWKEPEASIASVIVRSDGIISIPLAKEIVAAGFTPRELEQQLGTKLSKLIREAEVTVLVKEIHSERVYLIGAVRKEGPLVLQAPITVLQAIAEAGGLTDYAKRGSIYILRQENAKQTRIPFDYSAVIKGQRAEQNVMLRPGDTVVVP